MNNFETAIKSVEALDDAAIQLLKWASGEKIFCFNAPMGSGKTTFIKSLSKTLQYSGVVNSPTFPIINNYEGLNPIFHIDCYRLKDAEEGIQVGLEDCFFSGNYCFIEWADLVKKILPLTYVEVKIEIINETTRKISAKKIPHQ